MKKYSIFFIENDKHYPIYKQIGIDKYWLGGSRLEWLLFFTKTEAERVAKIIRKQKSPHFDRGTIKVCVAKLTPYN